MIMNKYTFKEIYKLPFILDEEENFVLSHDGIRAFNVLTTDINLVNDVLDVLNGKSDKVYTNVSFDDSTLIINGERVFSIRRYTINSNVEEERKIQHDLSDWIVEKLSK